MRVMKKILIGLFVLCVIGTIIRDLAKESDGPRASAAQGEDLAGVRGTGWTVAKQVLPAKLRHPSSAEYPWERVSAASYPDAPGAPHCYRVRGVVEAVNDFNAPITQPWTVNLFASGQDLTAWEVFLGDELVFQTPSGATISRAVNSGP